MRSVSTNPGSPMVHHYSLRKHVQINQINQINQMGPMETLYIWFRSILACVICTAVAWSICTLHMNTYNTCTHTCTHVLTFGWFRWHSGDNLTTKRVRYVGQTWPVLQGLLQLFKCINSTCSALRHYVATPVVYQWVASRRTNMTLRVGSIIPQPLAYLVRLAEI